MHGPLNVKYASNYLPRACGSAVLSSKRGEDSANYSATNR
jgi:hypothetical protein